MTEDPSSMDIDQLLAEFLPSLRTPRPDPGFEIRLETLLLDATTRDVAAPKRAWFSLRMVVAAAVVVATAVGLLRNEPLQVSYLGRPGLPDIPVTFSDDHKNADEMRFSLGQLIERSDVILSGRVVKGPAANTFRLKTRSRLMGHGEALSGLLKEDADPLSCPGPPTWTDGRWVVLFCVDGEVYSNQWKPEFDDEEALQRFEWRVRAYLDGSVLPTLIAELAEGGGPGPFAEPDRLVIDAVPMLSAAGDAEGLLSVAKKMGITGQAIDAIGALADAGGEGAERALIEIRDGEGWPLECRYRAIETLGRVGEGVLDAKTVAALEDPGAPYGLRQAAILAAGHAGKPEYADRLIRLFANVDDRSLGPDSDGSRPTKGSYVKADALIAMGRCGGRAARTFLLQQLKDGDDYYGYRARSATGLLELGDPTVIPELQQALLDPDTHSSSRGFIKKAIEGLSE